MQHLSGERITNVPEKRSGEKSKNFVNRANDKSKLRGQKRPTWVDAKTGLAWQCQSPGMMTWHEALEYAKALSLDGKNNWRLPSVRELETLLDRSKYRPVMRKEIPFRDNLSYWSSTTFGNHTNNAWIVMFDGGYVLSYYKSNAYYVRCVKG